MPRPQRELLRVTEINSFVNSSWYKYWVKSTGSVAECDRISKESSDFGTAVHRVVESFLLEKQAPTVTERQQFCGNLMIEWCKQTDFKPLIINGKKCIEYTLISKKLGYIGHTDVIGTFGNASTPYVCDWKTSKEIKLENILQLAAYAHALKEQDGIDCNDGVIIRTPSDPNAKVQFEAKPFYDLKRFFPVFKEAVDLVNFFKKRGRWGKILKGV